MWRLTRSLFLLALAALLPVMASASTVGAVSGSEWRAGRIIDDGVFTNANDMTVGEIQTFLNNQVGTGGYASRPGQCDTQGALSAAPFSSATRAEYARSLGREDKFTCLNIYYEVPKTSPGPDAPASNYGGAPIPAGAQSAAQIISNAAIKYNINPKALLVKLATESPGPLTSDDWPFRKQYLYAMGAHCPDSGPNGSANCDPNWAGFSLQMDEAASLLRWYLDSMTQSWWQYKRPYQVNYILWNVEPSGCGGSDVYIQTKATAALYTYTPYQPNQAALDNMYTTGDRCSAYGNRNFWRVWSDWFGSTRGDLVTSDGNTIYFIENGLKRVIPDGPTFLSHSYKWTDIVTISASEIAQIPNGAPMPYNVHYRDGKYVRVSDGVYLVENGVKRAIPDAITLLSYSYTFANVVAISDVEMAKIPNGPVVPYNVHYRDGKLISSDGNAVYLVENGLKRAIPDGETFASYSFKWSDIIRVSVSEITKIPNGADLPKRQ